MSIISPKFHFYILRKCDNDVFLVTPFASYSEVFHGQEWHNEAKYLSPTFVLSDKVLFVHDFVTFTHPVLGSTVAKLLKFFQKVRIRLTCI